MIGGSGRWARGRRKATLDRRSSSVALAVAGAALLARAACGASAGAGATAGESPPAGTAPATAAEPITGLQPGAWTWVDFPESACSDGSPTGIGVNAGTGPDLVLVLNGGGACWDWLTCYVLGTAAGGPFGRPQLEILEARALAGSILDRALPGNPFADATLVFVPYCTGDVHGGDRVTTYTGGGGQRTYHHVGHSNLVTFLRRVAATWPTPRRLVVSGSSAGGFGAVLNYDTIRSAFPASVGFLVDDSGPPLEPGAVSQTELDAWFSSWGLGDVLDPLCGGACRSGLSPGLSALARKYPRDRMALLSSLQDQVISNYFLLDGARFESELRRTAADVLAPLPNVRFFFVAGSSHTMLGDPAAFTQGVPLLTWLAQQVGGDAAWTSQQP